MNSIDNNILKKLIQPSTGQLIQLTRKFTDILEAFESQKPESLIELIKKFGQWVARIDKATCQHAIECTVAEMTCLIMSNQFPSNADTYPNNSHKKDRLIIPATDFEKNFK